MRNKHAQHLPQPMCAHSATPEHSPAPPARVPQRCRLALAVLCTGEAGTWAGRASPLCTLLDARCPQQQRRPQGLVPGPSCQPCTRTALSAAVLCPRQLVVQLVWTTIKSPARRYLTSSAALHAARSRPGAAATSRLSVQPASALSIYHRQRERERAWATRGRHWPGQQPPSIAPWNRSQRQGCTARPPQ